MTLEIFLAALRHAMTSAGVFVVAGGWAADTQWDEFSLAVVSVAGFAWSVYRKVARKQRTGSAS